MIKEIIEAKDSKDIEKCKGQLHEDFIFIDDFSMETKEDYVKGHEGMFSRNIDLKLERQIVLDKSECCGFQFSRNINGTKHRITNLYLLKEDKIWRHIINRTPI